MIISILLLTGSAGASTLKVSASGAGADYTMIQNAITAAIDGDTIEVYSGTYYKNVNVIKTLTLRGIGMPVVNAAGSGSPITLSADGIILEGFTATDSGPDSSGITVTSNYITLINNNASNNGISGIHVAFSNNNTIRSNIVSNNGQGIHLESSKNNTISSNNALNNVQGIRLEYSSENNMLSDNIASNNGDGISLKYGSHRNTLIGNNASRNGYDGIDLDYSSNNTLISNNAMKNGNAGISFYRYSNDNTLISNNVSNNNYGFNIFQQFSNNKIYNNIFNNNKNVEFFNSYTRINTWKSTGQSGTNIIGGSKLGGNFWATPGGTGFSQTCSDLNNDGICDETYVLDANNIDYLPLSYY